MTTRTYQMTRVESGDYLLPANDAQTLWRLTRYHEDGSAEREDGTPVVGTFWDLWRYRLPLAGALDLNWSAWSCFAQGFRTRAAAMDEALGYQVEGRA